MCALVTAGRVTQCAGLCVCVLERPGALTCAGEGRALQGYREILWQVIPDGNLSCF